MPTYIIEADCTATVRETWKITTAEPKTREELIDLFGRGNDCPPDVKIGWIDEQTSDERDREIVSVCHADNTPVASGPDADEDDQEA